MKLDLINSRIDPPSSYRVYDSVEDASLSSSLKGVSLVHLAPTTVKVRIGVSKRIKTFEKDRFNYSIVDSKGSYIFMQDRAQKAASHVKTNTVHSDPKDSNDSDSVAFLKPTYGMMDFQLHSSTRCFALDAIKDRIHDNFDYTIASRVAAKKVPAGVFDKADRGLDSISTTVSVGPGDYDVKNVDKKSVPSLTMSSTGRYKEVVLEEYMPLEKKLRLERMRSVRPVDGDYSPTNSHRDYGSISSRPNSISLASLDGKPVSPPSRLKPIGGFGKMERFSGPMYKDECYKKTSGLVLGPDYDAGFDKRIPFDISKSQVSSGGRSRSSSPVHDVDVDVGKYFSIQQEAARSPVKYSAAFKSKAPVGMKIEVPTTGTKIGPGSYPSAFKPTVVVKDPKKLSLSFRGGDKGLEIRRALPDGYDDPRPFSVRHNRGTIFSHAGSPDRKIHVVEVAEKKIKQIYPRLMSRKSSMSMMRSDSLASISSAGSMGSTSADALTAQDTAGLTRRVSYIAPPPVPYAMSPIDFRSALNKTGSVINLNVPG
ncbi:hypothetical protein EON65_31930 [archaeon]|nr:MAG: hypothetical protein EON65_31930 [archaeon]